MQPGLRIFLSTVACVVLVLGGATVVGLVQGLRAMTGAQQAAVLLQAGVEEQSAQRLQEGLETLQGALAQAQQAERWLFVPKVIPEVRSWSLVAQDALVAGREVVAAGEEMVHVLEDVQAVVGTPEGLGEQRGWSQLSSNEKHQLIETIEKSAVRVIAAQANVDRATAAVRRIDATKLPGEFAQLPATAEAMLAKLSSSLGSVAPFLSVLGDMAGTEDPAQWLVLYLNSSEIRPGGGFIGFYGLADVQDGELRTMIAEDTYAIDLPASQVPGYNVRAPAPLAQRLGVNGWYFRDAAWSPDFPETARTAVQLLRQETSVTGRTVPNPTIVLGITPETAAELVRAVGPLQLGSRTVTADELYNVLQYDTQKGFAEAGRGSEERKLLVQEATKALITKMFTLPPDQLFSVWNIMSEQMEQKQAAIYSTNAALQQAFAESGWTGALPAPEPGKDFLALIDANLGALKTDPAITRNIQYSLLSVDPENGVYHGVVVVKYRHNGSFDYKTTRYLTHAQLLVPPGARLLEATGGQPQPTTTVAGYTSFAQWVTVEPGQETTVVWAYEVPADIVERMHAGEYSLYVAKQLGGGDNLLTLDHTFDRNITAAAPAENGQFGDLVYEYAAPLTQDIPITIRF